MRRSRDLLLGAMIVALTFAAFLPVLGAGFIWDDDGLLTRNPLIRANDGLERIWLTMKARWFNNHVCRDRPALIERLDQAILDVIAYPSAEPHLETRRHAVRGWLLV